MNYICPELMKYLRLVTVAVLTFLPRIGAAAESTNLPKVDIVAEAVPKSDVNKLRLAIQILFQIDGKDKTILSPKEGAPFDPQSYSLTDEAGDAITVTPVIDKDVIEKDPPPLLRSIPLYPSRELDRTKKYFLTVKPGVLVFRLGTNVTDKVSNAQVT